MVTQQVLRQFTQAAEESETFAACLVQERVQSDFMAWLLQMEADDTESGNAQFSCQL